MVIDDVVRADPPGIRALVEKWFKSEVYTKAVTPFVSLDRKPEIRPKPLPGFERYAHVGSYKRPNRHLAAVNKTKKPLDAFNDTLPLGKTLHPTKGYRTRSERSVLCDMPTAEAKRSLRAWYQLWHPNFKVAA